MLRFALLSSLVGCGGSAPLPEPEPEPVAQTVIFVVLDTVRADHTHLCGYARPNTPVLDALRDGGASVSCGAHTPADWTLPSHASYFTGKQVLDHGAIIAPWSDVAILPTIPIRPLDAAMETLGEHFLAEGWLTAGISGNGVVSESAGLLQGFTHSKSGPPEEVTGPEIVRRTAALLGTQDRGKSLFLFVNLFDAHDPYPPVPEGLDWVPAQDAVDFFGADAEAVHALSDGTLDPEARAALLTRMTNGYDHGIALVDGALGRLLDTLRAGGWLDRPWRLVVTSDHGEGFDEHGFIRHGGFLTEEATRVPVLVADSAGAPPLPEHLAAIDVFHLVRDGRMPEVPSPAEAVSFTNPVAEFDEGVHSAVIWEGSTKWTWTEGTFARFDLATDPGEATPLPVTDGPQKARLEAMVAHSLIVGAAPAGDAALGETLEALGYAKKGE